MIRTLLATTAVATILATGAFAQDNAAPAAGGAATTPTTAQPAANEAGGQGQDGQMMQMNGHLASNLIGESVYSSAAVQAAQDAAEGEAAGTEAGEQAAQGGGEDAQTGEMTQTDQATQDGQQTAQGGTAGQAGQTGENIGEVNDVVISQDGRVESVVVGVGGFLGIGEKNVAMPFNELQWQQDGGGDRWIVVNTTREALENLPDFDRSIYEPAAANTAANTDGTTNGGMAPAAGVGAATGAGVAATTDAANNAGNAAANTANNAADTATGATDNTETGAIDRSQLQEIPQDQLTAETLVGTTVYGANDENIGEIGDIVLTQDGKVDAVLVDVGGFLGIGEKRVAVGMDKLQFLQDGNGNRYLYTNFSQEQLNAQAAYDEGSYSQNRDQQRLIVQ